MGSLDFRIWSSLVEVSRLAAKKVQIPNTTVKMNRTSHLNLNKVLKQSSL